MLATLYVQCNQSKDNNIWDRYYSNMREKIEIPALWVVLEFPKVFPISEIFHFFGREKRQNRRSSLPVCRTNSVKFWVSKFQDFQRFSK